MKIKIIPYHIEKSTRNTIKQILSLKIYFFRKLWRHNDVILAIFVLFVVVKNAKFKVILKVCSFKNVTFSNYFLERNILRPKPTSYDKRIRI